MQTHMKNPKHHFLTLKSLIIPVISFSCMPATGQIPYRNNPSASVPDNPVQVVINEIMADPSPVRGLPDAEWVELFNGGGTAVRLKDWKLVAGTVSRSLPDSLLPPGGYAIVCSVKAAVELKSFGKTVALATFPALRNSGTRLLLTTASDAEMDCITYSDSWYGSSAKKEGGWSLERIDPLRRCGQPANWIASADPSGGTPGKQNALFSPNPDHESPAILTVTVPSVHEVEITFSEPMDTLLLLDQTNYNLPEKGNPDEVFLRGENSVHLHWALPLEVNLNYRLTFGSLYDPCGNKLRESGLDVAFRILRSRDVVINELLFDPWPGGTDFVELYNRSVLPVNLYQLRLAVRGSDGGLKSLTACTGLPGSIPPGGYLAVTSDTAGVFPFYRIYCRSCIRQLTGFPPFGNDHGSVVLLSDSLVVLDEMNYSAEMHHPLLSDPEGVSLERVNPDEPAGNADNWQSASSEAGFATPGYCNSQYLVQPRKHSEIRFENASFSPDNDGYDDELVIGYQTPSPGWVANCLLFDASGRMIFRFLNNTLLSTSGLLTWDGKDGTGKRMPPGPYILFFELFDAAGHVEHHRKAVVLTVRGDNY
jgi:hypothetical protein